MKQSLKIVSDPAYCNVSGLNVYIKFSDSTVSVSLVFTKAFLARPKTLYSNEPSGLYWRHRTVSSRIGSSSLISSLNSSLVNFSSFHFLLKFEKKVGQSGDYVIMSVRLWNFKDGGS